MRRTSCAPTFASSARSGVLRAALATLATATACASLAPDPAGTASDPHAADRLSPYVQALRDQGRDPVSFVVSRLRDHDLLLFDDGIHSAAEPFDFYRELLADPDFAGLLDVVFLEAVPLNQQPALDAYLDADEDDPTLLYPAFQSSTGGLGWSYETYFELLRAVREANAARPEARRIRVVGVTNPTWWSEVRTPRDVELFRRSLLGRDYDMYKVILDEMDGFSSGRKGVFFTNTRHAYNDVRRRDGTPFWNTGTFFHRWHPGKTYSLRIHNLALFIESVRPEWEAVKTTEGMERLRYHWGRMANGLWDSAFAALGDRPVVLPLAGNPFGREAYVGNHMAEAAPGQTMSDAYDALVFVAPLDNFHRTALDGAMYTPEYQREVARRFALLYPGDAFAAQLAAEGVSSIDQLTAAMAAGEPRQPLSLVQDLGPIDAWKAAR